MRRVLFLSYLFPPMGGGGVQRTLGFVRHLPAAGWLPTIVAGAEGAPYWAWDPSLVEKIPPEAEVVRVAEGPFGLAARMVRRLLPAPFRTAFDRGVLVPDRHVTWLPGAFFRALALARRTRFDAVYSTGGPWTNLVLGDLIHSATGLPWVADFRDPWTQSPFFAPVTRAHRRAAEALEAGIHARASVILANTRSSLAAFERAFPAARGKVLHLPNGYDEDDFEGLAAPPGDRSVRLLTYVGSFYPGYGPEPFLRILAAALRGAPRLRGALRVRFIGNTDESETIARHGLEDVVEELGYLPHRRALEHLVDSDASLAVVPDAPDRSPFIPQKLFVYLRAGRPILLVGPAGDAADLLREAGGGSLGLRPDDPEASARLGPWLERLVDAPPRQDTRDPAFVERFERRALTLRLAAALDRAARSSGPPPRFRGGVPSMS